MTAEDNGYNFAKGKRKRPIVISDGEPEKSNIKQPSPNTTLTEASRKWHETRGQGK